MATRDRVRGMNAAFTTGQAGVGEMTPAKTPLRPRKLIVAVLVAGVAAGVGTLTYQAVAANATSFSGQVTPAHAYYLNFVNEGTLAAMNVRPGQQVKAGQVLATEDSTVDQANLKAAQAEVAADTTELAADQNPQVGPQQQATNQVDVTKAQQAVAAAQLSLSLAQNTAQNTIAAASSAVAGRQSVLDADTARYNDQCSGGNSTIQSGTVAGAPPPSSATQPVSPPTGTTSCAALQAQIVRDNSALSDAQAQLSAAQASSRAEQQRDASQVTASQTTLATAQGRADTTALPITASTIAQVQSDLATAQAQVVTDEQRLHEDTLLAPGDGTVADIAGATGDVISPDGVHDYNGPAAERGTLSSQQASGFQLFVQPDATGGGTTQNATYAPVVTLYTGPMTVTAQLPEENMGGTHLGQGVTLAVTAIGQTVHGTVSQILLDPTRVPNATYYDVVISMSTQPAAMLPGMTVNVTLN